MKSILLAFLLFNTLIYSQEKQDPTKVLPKSKLKNVAKNKINSESPSITRKNTISSIEMLKKNLDTIKDELNKSSDKSDPTKKKKDEKELEKSKNPQTIDETFTSENDKSKNKSLDKSDPTKKKKDEKELAQSKNPQTIDETFTSENDKSKNKSLDKSDPTKKKKDEKELEQSKNPQTIDETFISENDKSKNTSLFDNLAYYIKIVLILLIVIFIVYWIIKKHKILKKKIALLENENGNLKNDCKKLNIEIQNLNNKLGKSTKINQDFKGKSSVETRSIKTSVVNNIMQQNTLTENEVTELKENQENRWVTIGHSAIGKNHTNTTPIIPCQDNNHFESLSDKFQLAIVCDGAGSAKRSHYGSKFLSQGAIPKNIKLNLENLNWFKNGEIPTKLEWNKLSKNILKQSYTDLKIWVNSENKKKNISFSVNEFASTVIITIYNSKGVLVVNIGDGRAGYLNNKGQLQPLFTPYGGEESNGTIFITSPIWDEPESFIQSNVFSEDILSVFLLSDGMEKSTFECSNLTNDVFVDPNMPYKKFFLPIFSKIKSISTQEEEKLSDEWKKFLESGTEAIKIEGDDKTLVISFLK
jgi:hypothetical protein